VNGTVDVTFTADALVMVAGDRRIQPDEDTRRTIGFAGVVEVAGSFEVCSNADGVPTQVTLTRSTEYPAYDRALEEGIRRWRFIPREVHGKYVPSCMQARFTYRPWRD
jgi:TonB family protein